MYIVKLMHFFHFFFPQIMLSQMHLTGLANVSIDNPTKVTAEQITENVMNFLDTDTVLFFSDVSNVGVRVGGWGICAMFCLSETILSAKHAGRPRDPHGEAGVKLAAHHRLVQRPPPSADNSISTVSARDAAHPTRLPRRHSEIFALFL